MSKEQEKDKGGRPPIVLTDEQKKKVRELASICTTEQIADYLGISRTTFFEILNRDDEISVLYKKGKAEGHNFVASKLMERVQKDDTSAMIFYLKTQSRWKEPKDEDEIKDNKLEIVVKVKEHENLDKLTPEQIKQLKDKGSL